VVVVWCAVVLCQSEELGQLLSSIGIEMAEEELANTMTMLDDSGDGHISFKELLAW
jgi:Ca2+-binding EF-hand superfamily protein